MFSKILVLGSFLHTNGYVYTIHYTQHTTYKIQLNEKREEKRREERKERKYSQVNKKNILFYKRFSFFLSLSIKEYIVEFYHFLERKRTIIIIEE